MQGAIVQPTQIETQLLAGCRRLASKGFLKTPADSFSLRVPGSAEMIIASGCKDWREKDWREIGVADLHTAPFSISEGGSGPHAAILPTTILHAAILHAAIYRERADVGAVAISSPKGARLLAHCGGCFPTLFDEQARHLGAPAEPLADAATLQPDVVRNTFRRGTNAVLLGEQLLCLGMTCERVLCNVELYEKCAQAYVIAKASGNRIRVIPGWVRLIANRRLLRDERRAAASYRNGVIPEGIGGY
ncbi:MAG: class II aldolase/adducin family protein [Terriglobales bacterium]